MLLIFSCIVGQGRSKDQVWHQLDVCSVFCGLQKSGVTYLLNNECLSSTCLSRNSICQSENTIACNQEHANDDFKLNLGTLETEAQVRKELGRCLALSVG